MRIKYILLSMLIVCACNESQDASSPAQGSGGSLTRFAIKDSFLYIATGSTINVYDIAQPALPELTKINVGFGLETIQTNGDFLYLGARDAMYIYSIAIRDRPEFIFRYSHIVSCDPVVVQGNRAYVTLRSGNRCNLGTNTLEIIDISNPNQPIMLQQYQMTSPGGLGISGSCLFVCEGQAGLKMLSVANDQVKLLHELTDVNAYDVIVKETSFTLTGEDGIFQYNYTCDPGSLTLISKIPVQRAEF